MDADAGRACLCNPLASSELTTDLAVLLATLHFEQLMLVTAELEVLGDEDGAVADAGDKKVEGVDGAIELGSVDEAVTASIAEPAGF